MIGAIAGDIIGSVYEFAPIKTPDFPLFSPNSDFTDDSVLTVAIADVLLNGGDLVDTLKEYTKKYPGRGYGGSYHHWAHSDERNPYHSWGNGSAMRTSPIGFFFNERNEVLDAARKYAAVTHDHPHGINGAQAWLYPFSWHATVPIKQRFARKSQVCSIMTSQCRLQSSAHPIALMYHARGLSRNPSLPSLNQQILRMQSAWQSP